MLLRMKTSLPAAATSRFAVLAVNRLTRLTIGFVLAV
jgi:hypothetical protein